MVAMSYAYKYTLIALGIPEEWLIGLLRSRLVLSGYLSDQLIPITLVGILRIFTDKTHETFYTSVPVWDNSQVTLYGSHYSR